VALARPVAVRLETGDHRRGQIYVALGAVAWSTAGLAQRDLTVGPATQLGGRAAFALLTLFAFVVVSDRDRGVVGAFRSIGRTGLVVAGLMAVSSATFIVALNHTSVAHLLFLLAIAPLAAALLARVTLGEEIAPRTWIAMLIALVGVTLMVSTGGGGGALGNVLAIVSMLSFAASIVITRHRREISMAPATCLSQLFVVVACIPFVDPGSADARDVLLLASLGIGQIGLGLALLTIGARLIPAAQTALISLLEVVLGPLWVWIAYTEQPSAVTLVGGAIIVVGILVQMGYALPRRLGRPVEE
jgi:drug/metabolite transporter (DMT)-like permease